MGNEAGTGEKKILGRKRHLVVDTQGLPLGVWVYPADISDAAAARDILPLVKGHTPRLRHIWADQAYGGALVDEVRRELGCTLEVVRRPKGQRGFVVLPRRWVVERSFGWLNRFRRLSKDFECWLENSEAMIKIAFIHLMVKRAVKRS